MDDRDAAIQALLDKDAIRDVILRYARGIDRHDAGLMASAYHPDATDDHGAYVGDAAGFIAYANEVHSADFVAHQHHMTNCLIDLDGDRARGETYYLAVLRTNGGGLMAVGGRYLDQFERRDGGWAISDRTTLVDWNGELTGAPATHVAQFLAGGWGETDPSYLRATGPLRAALAG